MAYNKNPDNNITLTHWKQAVHAVHAVGVEAGVAYLAPKSALLPG